VQPSKFVGYQSSISAIILFLNKTVDGRTAQYIV